MTADDIKSHPDYKTGYFDAIDDRPNTGYASVEYADGRSAGLFARDAFLRAGFKQDSEDSFSLSMKL